MARIRNGSPNNFVIINRKIFTDKNLGYTERGVLGTLLQLSEVVINGKPWDFSIRGLAEITPDGKSKVESSLKKLEKLGYLIRRRIIDEKGRFIDLEYIVFDEPVANPEEYKTEKCISEEPEVQSNYPHPDFRDLDNRYPDNRYPENRDPENRDNNIIKNNIIKNNISKNNKIKKDDIKKQSNNPSIYQSKQNNVFLKKIEKDRLMERIADNIGLFNQIPSIDMEDILESEGFPLNTSNFSSENYEWESMYFEAYNIICDVVTAKGDKPYTICGQEYPQEVVKSTFMKLTEENVIDVLNSLLEMTEPVKNMRSYMISSLYNSFLTLKTKEMQGLKGSLRKNGYL